VICDFRDEVGSPVGSARSETMGAAAANHDLRAAKTPTKELSDTASTGMFFSSYLPYCGATISLLAVEGR